MKTVPVSAERHYQVEIGVQWRSALNDWVEGRNKVVAITSEKFAVKTDLPTIEVPDGESGKSAEVLTFIWEQLGKLGINRGDLIIGIGGGALTDLVGFAAATWMRGIDWLAIPTTVAGMVDAAIGGKTAINSTYGKNLIGAFHSPVGVLIDLDFIKSLEARDDSAGMAEVIKCGFIAEREILELLRNKSLKDVMNDPALQEELIFRAVSVKAGVVGIDFKESYEREILNYGHTLDHAIEKHSGFTLRHGEAVAIGMCFIAELARLRIGLAEEVVALHRELIQGMKLPISYKKEVWDELLDLMALDKKAKAGTIRFVAIDAISSCTRIEDATFDEMKLAYQRISL